MIRTICPQYCPLHYCELACPAGAIRVSPEGVLLDTDRCHVCALCRVACLTWSRDKGLERVRLD